MRSPVLLGLAVIIGGVVVFISTARHNTGSGEPPIPASIYKQGQQPRTGAAAGSTEEEEQAPMSGKLFIRPPKEDPSQRLEHKIETLQASVQHQEELVEEKREALTEIIRNEKLTVLAADESPAFTEAKNDFEIEQSKLEALTVEFMATQMELRNTHGELHHQEQNE